jgi:lipid-A-disaccharide synthase
MAMTPDRPIKVAIIAGEESGDLLGADLLRALESVSGRDVELTGVGGRHLQAMGLKSMFDPAAIALMGVSAIVRDLPQLVARIGRTAKAVADAAPDCLVTIDSPEFTLRVAKKVRARNPSIPIIHYVCPSVWAWRPSRAAAMRPYVDHILCILPFEVDELARLGGPPGTYVGHRLTHDAGILHAAHLQSDRQKPTSHDEKTLLILPGSRRSEVKGLSSVFGDTVSELMKRGHTMRLLLPTLPQLADLVEAETAKWPQHPEIIIHPARKWQAFGEADAALAASGTVSLELALCRVPLVACYQTDRLMRLLLGMITTWSASLPNLIVDRVIVPEYYDIFIRPGMIARQIEQLMTAGSDLRRLQLNGFAEVKRRLATARRAGVAAADVVLEHIGQHSNNVGDRHSPT